MVGHCAKSHYINSFEYFCVILFELVVHHGVLRIFTISLMPILHPREVLLREGHFGPCNGHDSMKPLLECAYSEFMQWRRANKIPCSQKSFALRHLLKKAHGYYLTTKAYNARVVMQWLSAKLQEVAQHAAASPSIKLHCTALLLC